MSALTVKLFGPSDTVFEPHYSGVKYLGSEYFVTFDRSCCFSQLL